MSGSGILLLLFLVATLSLGCFFGLAVLLDLLMYRDLQRRLREEERSRMKRESR